MHRYQCSNTGSGQTGSPGCATSGELAGASTCVYRPMPGCVPICPPPRPPYPGPCPSMTGPTGPQGIPGPDGPTATFVYAQLCF